MMVKYMNYKPIKSVDASHLPGGGEQLGDSNLQCVSEVQGQACYWKWEPQFFCSKMHLGLVFFFNFWKVFLNQKKWSLFLHKPTV